MSEVVGRALVQRLRSREFRSRTGILLLNPAHLGHEEDLAARLNIDAVDYARWVASTTPAGSRFLGIDAASELERLDAIASRSGGRDCVLIFNLDLILAKLDYEARLRLWSALRADFPNRSRALVLALPEQATLVQPDGQERAAWEAGERLTGSEPRSNA